jgi:hypothetical protein
MVLAITTTPRLIHTEQVIDSRKCKVCAHTLADFPTHWRIAVVHNLAKEELSYAHARCGTVCCIWNIRVGEIKANEALRNSEMGGSRIYQLRREGDVVQGDYWVSVAPVGFGWMRGGRYDKDEEGKENGEYFKHYVAPQTEAVRVM